MHCPHERTAIREREINGNIHHEKFCLVCDRHITFVRQEMTPERARTYKMPFGKHAGKQLDEIPRDYLQWMQGRELKRNIAEAIQVYLDFFPPEPNL